MTTFCTFNVNNLFVRYRFGSTFPGDPTAKSAVDDPTEGYLPMYNTGAFDIYNPAQRDLAGHAITRGKDVFPDVVCLQEVESLIALRVFNEMHLEGRYKHALLIDSRDFRQIDVGILSNLEIQSVRSNMDDLDPEPDDPERPWLFSRDCLEVSFRLSGGRGLTLFVNHLKSKFIDWHNVHTPEEREAERQKNDRHRLRQAKRVARIVRRRFPGDSFDSELFAVVGDFNDTPASDPVRPLVHDAGLVDALARIPKPEERWTHWFRSENSVSQLDYVLLSPALAAATDGHAPKIERRGISFARVLADGGIGPKETHYSDREDDPSSVAVPFQFPRFEGVNDTVYASDHCPVFFTVP
jgi:endonuclease/exonuclease/phosphatase family metal-dependent hydrolase